MERPRLKQAVEPPRRRQTQPHPHPAQPFRRLRPARRLGQKLGETLGVRKARQARDVQKLDGAHALAPGEERKGLDRRVLGVQQRMHEGGREHGLARALQAGDGDAIRVVLERRGTGERRSDGIQGRGGEASQSEKRCHGMAGGAELGCGGSEAHHVSLARSVAICRLGCGRSPAPGAEARRAAAYHACAVPSAEKASRASAT